MSQLEGNTDDAKNDSDFRNFLYQQKYLKLKREIKRLVFENASLCDEVSLVQAQLSVAREDRLFLIKRLLRHEGYESIEREICFQDDETNAAPASSTMASSAHNFPLLAKKRNTSAKRIIEARNQESVTTSQTPSIKDESRQKSPPPIVKMELAPLETGGSNNNGGVPAGKLNAPLNLFNILLHSIGQLVTVNPNFHSEHWIYPIGYVASRIYAHPRDPQRKCVFTCKILNNAGNPQFQIIPDNDLDAVIFADSPSICHLTLLQAIQASLGEMVKLPMLQVQGERFFGLANASIQSMLMRADGANIGQCINFRGFLPPQSEEKDPTLSFEALQSLINMSTYHTMPEIKDEPPDELFEFN